MFASLQRKPRSGPQTVCHSKPIKDSNAVFFVVLQDFCHAPRSSRVRPVWRNKPNVCFFLNKSCCRVLQHVQAWPEWVLWSTKWTEREGFKGLHSGSELVFSLLRWTGLNSLCQGPGEAGGIPVFTWSRHRSSLQKRQHHMRIDREQGQDHRSKMTPGLLIIFKMELFWDLYGYCSISQLTIGDRVKLLSCDGSISSRPYFRPLSWRDLGTKTVKRTPYAKLQA